MTDQRPTKAEKAAGHGVGEREWLVYPGQSALSA